MDFLIWGFEEFCKAHTAVRKSAPATVTADATALGRLFNDQIEKDLHDLDFIGNTDVVAIKEELDAISLRYLERFILKHS
jgi:hypothetical protein